LLSNHVSALEVFSEGALLLDKLGELADQHSEGIELVSFDEAVEVKVEEP